MFFFCYRLERVRSETDSPGWRNSKIIKQRWGRGGGPTPQSQHRRRRKRRKKVGKKEKRNENTNIQPSAGLFMESGRGACRVNIWRYTWRLRHSSSLKHVITPFPWQQGGTETKCPPLPLDSIHPDVGGDAVGQSGGVRSGELPEFRNIR